MKKKNIEKSKKSTIIVVLVILIVLAVIIDIAILSIRTSKDKETIYVKCVQKTIDVEYANLDISYSFHYQNKKIFDTNEIYKYTFKDKASYDRINEDRIFISMTPESKIVDEANLIKEYSFDTFIPYDKIKNVEDYIKMVEEKNYTCTITNEKEEKSSIRLAKNVECYQENISKNQAELNLNYSVIKDSYSFYVSDKNSLIPNKWTMDLHFNTTEDLNTYYNYLINVLLEPEEKYLKDEENNIITYVDEEKLQLNEQKFLTYGEEYLNYLNGLGYTCSVTDLNSNS